jgi:serine/threonine protein kinase
MESTTSLMSGASSAKSAGSNTPMFMDSNKGNIKEQYHFKEKLANGGFGVVYLAEHRVTKDLFAVKAIQKKKVKDYATFVNEINILKVLVSSHHKLLIREYRITLTLSNCTKFGNGMMSAS